jgi:7-carboxy-7-deazaguanine synthase
MLKVNEIFLSVQGEGISAGYPTVFVRLTGCNLRCSYCDTTYSYDEGEDCTVDEVMKKIESFGYKRVCITGGEPLLQEKALKELLSRLESYEVSIETNGSVDLSRFPLAPSHRFTMDIKTPSSDESEKNYIENFKYLRETDEIKAVIGNRADYLWAVDIIDSHYKKGSITFSPMFGIIEPDIIIGWILEDKRDIRFQIQIHKVIWDSETRGV